MWKRRILIAAGIAAAFAAEARADYQPRLTAMGMDLATLVGTADYCGNSGQALFDVYVAGLPHFRLGRGDIDTLVAAMQARRQQSYADTGAALANQGAGPGQCPPELADKVREATREMENAWYRVVKNEVGVDLRRQAAPTVVQTAAAAGPSGSLCAAGKPVSVLYGGQWYPARVLQGPDRMGTCLVAYDGYGSNWDEWVSANRMRPAAAESAPRQAPPRQSAAPDSPPTASTGAQSVPVGKYSCYTFDNGQLNYTYTDVVIEAGGRYAVGNKGGNYTLSPAGALSFTGTMSNASGKFSIKTGGKPQIDLVFNGDTRASMTCPKAR